MRIITRLTTLFILSVILITTLSCNITIPRIQTGETQTFQVSESTLDIQSPAQITLAMGAGKLTVEGGSDKLIEGSISYNVDGWKPDIRRDDDSITIDQNSDFISGIPTRSIVNNWDLKLGQSPINLTVNAGAYEGDLRLGGLALNKLTISDGASNTTVDFDTPNRVSMTSFIYKTGASNVTLNKLSNANFEKMDFESGAGSFTLDFAGELQKNADIRITSGVSNVKIIIPNGTSSKIQISGGLNNISTTGTWTTLGTKYSTAGEGPTLNIWIEMGLGSLELIQK